MAINPIYSKVIWLSLMFTALVTLRLEANETKSVFSKVTVEIINELDKSAALTPHPSQENVTLDANKDIILTLHCKSKDDDLGVHNISLGSTFSFQFKPSIFAQTLFFCSFVWPQQPYRHYVDVYDEAYDNCHLCSWKVRQTQACRNDGVCDHYHKLKQGARRTLKE